MCTITGGVTYGGNRGSQWVCDALGPRQWTLQEECAIHNIDDTAKAFLMTLPPDKALGCIARSFPVAPLTSMYAQFEAGLRSYDEPNYTKQEGMPAGCAVLSMG